MVRKELKNFIFCWNWLCLVIFLFVLIKFDQLFIWWCILSIDPDFEYKIGSIIKNVIKKFSDREDVIGVIIYDLEGFPLASNLPPEQSEKISAYAGLILAKAKQTAKAVKNAGELTSVAIETETRELLITPDADMPLIFAVLRKLN